MKNKFYSRDERYFCLFLIKFAIKRIASYPPTKIVFSALYLLYFDRSTLLHHVTPHHLKYFDDLTNVAQDLLHYLDTR